MRRLVGICLAAVLATGCRPQPVNFGGVAPTYGPGDYARVHERWTRRAHLISRGSPGIPVDLALDAYVTLLAPDFRAAYLVKVAAMFQQTPEQKAAMAAQERQNAEDFVEFYVELESSRWDWGLLSSKSTVWSITMIDDQGHVVGDPEIQPATERPMVRTTLFPPVTPFNRAWRFRFRSKLPDGNPVLGLATRSITLRFAGPLGQEEVRWEGLK